MGFATGTTFIAEMGFTTGRFLGIVIVLTPGMTFVIGITLGSSFVSGSCFVPGIVFGIEIASELGIVLADGVILETETGLGVGIVLWMGTTLGTGTGRTEGRLEMDILLLGGDLVSAIVWGIVGTSSGTLPLAELLEDSTEGLSFGDRINFIFRLPSLLALATTSD